MANLTPEREAEIRERVRAYRNEYIVTSEPHGRGYTADLRRPDQESAEMEAVGDLLAAFDSERSTLRDLHAEHDAAWAAIGGDATGDLAHAIGQLTAALTEARLEIAAFMGRPEGAINEHWRFSWDRWWRELPPERSLEADLGLNRWVLHDNWYATCGESRISTVRENMRLAEAEARKRGWL